MCVTPGGEVEDSDGEVAEDGRTTDRDARSSSLIDRMCMYRNLYM